MGVVRGLLGKQLLTRKSDQSFNIGVVVPSLLMMVGIIWGYTYLMNASGNQAEEREAASRATREARRGEQGIQAFTVPTLYGQGVVVTGTSIPTMEETLYPTYTFYPTVTSIFGEPFYYSSYDPAIVVVGTDVREDGSCINVENGICHTINCWSWDVVEGECISKMTSGLDWRDYYGKSVACGDEYPLYTIFRVIEPMVIAGDYECLDRCPYCTGKKVLDFLSNHWDLQWLYPLNVQVIRR